MSIDFTVLCSSPLPSDLVAVHASRELPFSLVIEPRWDGRRMTVVLADGRELEVARRCHARLRATLERG